MWDVIGQILNTFLEKYFVPTIISIVAAIISLLILPTDFWIITKIGKPLLFILVAGIAFLFIMLILNLVKKISEINSDKSQKKRRYQKDMEKEREFLEKLWSQVDAISPDDRQLLKEFIASGNAPIEKSSGTRYFGNSIFNSNWLVSTEDYGEDEQEVILSENVKEKLIPKNSNIFSSLGGRTIIKKYKLRNEIYQALKYSMDNYGIISHFE